MLGEVVVVVVSVLWLLKLELCCTSSGVGVMFRENAYDAGGCFVVDDRFVVCAYNVDSEFLR
jgi:hypothetical protein